MARPIRSIHNRLAFYILEKSVGMATNLVTDVEADIAQLIPDMPSMKVIM